MFKKNIRKISVSSKSCIFYDKHNQEENFVEGISINCRSFNKDTGIHIKNTTIEEMITKFVLNEILHHVGMLWIISSNNKFLYEIEDNNHPSWFNKGTWYNTAICS